MSLKQKKSAETCLKSLQKQGLGPFTVDDFLGGTVRLIQLEKGYRAGMDAVLLAASCDAECEGRALDVGAGTGAVALCLARRCPGVFVDGLEIQNRLVAIARANADFNKLSDRCAFHQGSILENPIGTPENYYDFVFCNPPYFEGEASRHSPSKTKDLAHTGEGEARLKNWVNFALSRVKNKGVLSFIFTADRVDELLSLLYRRAGETVIFPFWPRSGLPAKRVLIQARKGLRGPATIAPGFALHGKKERYSAEAEAVLRDGQGLNLSVYHRAKGP